MSGYGCENCKWLKCYPGDRWTPPEYECKKDGPEDAERFTRVWENSETWNTPEECLCEHYKELTEDDFYDNRF